MRACGQYEDGVAGPRLVGKQVLVDQTDAQVIARAASDPAAFAIVFDRHYDTVYRYAAARLGQHDGEEIAAQTFLVALERIDRYDMSRPSARPWLFGIATNLVRHHHRRAHRTLRAHARLRAALARPGDDEATAVDLREDTRPVLAAIEALPRGERDVLLLFAWADLGYEEIAAALEVPIGTVRSRLHRARVALRGHLSASLGDAA